VFEYRALTSTTGEAPGCASSAAKLRPITGSTPRIPAALHITIPAIGRLRPGVSVPQASTDIAAIAQRIVQQSPEQNDYLLRSAAAVSMQESMTGRVRSLLYILLGAVGFLLLVACANAANLLLAPASKRGRELAIRHALGAGEPAPPRRDRRQPTRGRREAEGGRRVAGALRYAVCVGGSLAWPRNSSLRTVRTILSWKERPYPANVGVADDPAQASVDVFVTAMIRTE
jgi:hypothetical protein